MTTTPPPDRNEGKGPKDFQTEHAMIGCRLISAKKFYYIFSPKRLPRKLKKQRRKIRDGINKFRPARIKINKKALKDLRVYPETPDQCFSKPIYMTTSND
jgi:hypothetical protein